MLLYLAVNAGLAFWRDTRVDTWADPTPPSRRARSSRTARSSGRVRDDLFPSWIRFDRKVYRLTDAIRPMGFEPDAAFPATGYSHGSMTLFRIANTPDGIEGKIVAVKLATSAVGRAYRLADCI